MKNTIFIFSMIAAMFIVSCSNTQVRQYSDNSKELTVGVVQKEIHKGMSGAEVTEALGSPNIVTKDENSAETWVYDKIASEVTYTRNSDGLFIIFAGSTSSSGAKTVTQKTLTVVIKFDDNNKVSSFSYHASKF